MWMKDSYDDHEARQDECQGCHGTAADIGDLCEVCFLRERQARAEELGEGLAKVTLPEDQDQELTG